MRNPKDPRLEVKSWGNTDGNAYVAADSGCKEATAKLGYPSCCLTNCPFPEECMEILVKERQGAGRPKGT